VQVIFRRIRWGGRSYLAAINRHNRRTCVIYHTSSCERYWIHLSLKHAKQISGVSVLNLLSELWLFLRVRKKMWLLPPILLMLLLGAFLFFVQGSSVAPFIYTLF
jgi:hypothetical protein